MKKKAIFFDIDGTLYNVSLGVPESTIQGITELKKNGHLTFLATGRARAMIPKKLLDLEFDGILAACGTYVEYGNNLIYNINLKKYISNKAIYTLRKYNVFFVLEGSNYLYMDEWKDFDEYKFSLQTFKNEFSNKIKPITEIDTYFNKITCITNELKNFKKAYKILEKDFNCIYHNSGFIELVPKGYSKVNGIERIIKHLNIDINDTYAFGDSLNDIDMINYVKYGVAMKNSSPEVLNIAKYKTDSIENDGIYKGLKHFNLI